MTDRYEMTLGGRAVQGERWLDVVNPATGEVLAQCPDATREQLNEAVAGAAKAQKDWQRDDSQIRTCLQQASGLIRENIRGLSELLTREQGKPTREATAELLAASAWFRYYSELEVPVQVLTDDESARIEVRHRPLGVVAAITPWNYPVLMAVWKLAPALRAGNAVILKPSPFTPLTSLRLGRLLAEILPDGVLSVLSGGDELGAWMTTHPTVRKISLTGSVVTGKRVAQAAAPDLKRLTLELGGNDPAIVLSDVEPEEVAERLFWGAFTNNGQVCTAIKRLYVHQDLFPDLVEALTRVAREVRVGDGSDPKVRLGPINNRPQFVRVCELVEDARRQGARILHGGEPLPGPGNFYPPTIVTGVGEGVRIVDEEQFGPALPVIPFRNVEEVLTGANGTHFGLSGSVWSGNPERAAEVASGLECGTVWINTHMDLRPDVPFGGLKWSGLGVTNGRWGLDDFSEVQVIHHSKR